MRNKIAFAALLLPLTPLIVGCQNEIQTNVNVSNTQNPEVSIQLIFNNESAQVIHEDPTVSENIKKTMKNKTGKEAEIIEDNENQIVYSVQTDLSTANKLKDYTGYSYKIQTKDANTVITTTVQPAEETLKVIEESFANLEEQPELYETAIKTTFTKTRIIFGGSALNAESSNPDVTTQLDGSEVLITSTLDTSAKIVVTGANESSRGLGIILVGGAGAILLGLLVWYLKSTREWN